MSQYDTYIRLCHVVEQTAGITVATPNDFELLSHIIFQRQRVTLSASTLKRLWGYFPSVQLPHQYTTDLLTRYVESLRQCQLTKGAEFQSVGEYLHLFGICDGQAPPPSYWSQPLPEHLGIIIWGPEYQHPEWHNQGDATHLMPTITEWWTPTEKDDASAEIRNHDNYLRASSFHELRITFMKNITGSGYTFLGVYGLSTASSPQRLVWQRVADHLDLRHLDQLELLRQ